ncbi:response regulator transcription factor [Sphingosinicella terrae]|uniref:response regulator transcription factor n=1 Tax=Sphingosinicella terrae TaxID=2172047 RepID=UPI000E0D3DC9|nr:response regulator transcription factor [Sphingosinicella terrae]
MRIGILEDDPATAEQLRKLLSLEGHSCFLYQSGQKLIGFLSRETVDVLILDWNVPDVPGIDVIRWVRSENARHPPIVVLTARAAEEDIVTALKAGADEYVVKPVQPAVLLARIEALCRRAYPEPARGRVEQFGDYAFDSATETVRVRQEAVQLTAKEFALALMLFHNLNRTLSRSYIFEAVWGGSPDLQTRTLDAHISKVRTKLGLRAANGYRLVPIYAYGYRLEATGDGFE